MSSKATTDGITLVALVVTIVVLLILAGITITYVMGDNSIFKKASDTKLQTEITKARERLEITFNQAKIFKHTDNKYNQDDYLDELMKKEIPNIKILEDVVIVDGYAFEIDRSEPKIGQYIGEEKDLVFPEISATVTIADDKKNAIIHITAKELIEVDGIVMSIQYTPNGNEEYQKEHQVKVSVNETDDRIKSIKYQWLNTTAEPEESTFTTVCNNEETITKNGVTGTYYLWTLLETEKGKKRIERSEAFYFDNSAPIVTLDVQKGEVGELILLANTSENESGMKTYEFYMNEKLINIQNASEQNASYIVKEVETDNNVCKVIAKDVVGNSAFDSRMENPKLYTWEVWNVAKDIKWEIRDTGESKIFNSKSETKTKKLYENYTINSSGKPMASGRAYTYEVGGSTPTDGRTYHYCDFEEKIFWEVRSMQSNTTTGFVSMNLHKYETYEKSSTPIKGNTKKGEERSLDSNKFVDGKNGDNWYVGVGVK